MPINHLREKLRKLRDEIAQTDTRDEPERALLDHIQQDIDQLLGCSDEEVTSEHPIGQKIDQAVAQMEVSHPTLTDIMAEVTYALSKIGI